MAKKSSIMKRSRDFERWMAHVLGGNRIYGQSAKGMLLQSDGDATGGDVKNNWVLGECKSYDCKSSTKWRKENPAVPAKSFSIKVEWINQIRSEAAEVSKHPFLAFNNKFDPLVNTHIIISLDMFIQMLYGYGWCPYESVEEAWAAWKRRGMIKIEEKEGVNDCSDKKS